MREGRWKLIHDLDSGRSELFDLANDPDERVDLAHEQEARVAEWRAHLLRWGAAARARALSP